MTPITILNHEKVGFPKLLLSLPPPTWKGDGDAPVFVLDSDVLVELIVLSNRVSVLVRKGYMTDLASIPKPLQGFFQPDDPKTVLATLIHDALYESRGGLRYHPSISVSGMHMTREESDATRNVTTTRQSF